MIRLTFSALAAAAALSSALIAPAVAQGALQTVLPFPKPTQLATTGYRASKIVGSDVINESGDKVGTIDDLIVTASEKIPYAVLSVGGFLGVGTKFVVVPFNSLEIRDQKMLLRDATLAALKNLPDFKYSD